ncbi:MULTISPECIES: GGDEF domain-containing protein [unclassified Lebetimonas]|uniref:GGDEF domain-containing protein n=1 Tax=unclassified Lebetimonas TaxID=2648158 RepID=UPI000465E643|nr:MULTISPECIES: GGDEF domain-containing protein [unclassified Lebetimonas]
MEELIEKISGKTINELKKANKPAYPLYYRDVFVNITREEKILDQLNPRLLCIEPNLSEELINKTADTVKNINQTSNNIKEESIKLLEKIEPVEAEEVKSLVIQYSSKLLDQINKMQNKINELEMELDRAYKELLVDPLTKAFNRKAFEKDINEILEAGKNRDLDMALAIVDLDHFKEINDTYGHLVGDFVLKKLVEIVRRLLRKEHKIYRIGGDEFVILLNRTDLKAAEVIIERIVKTMEKTKMKYKEHLIDITISVGLTMHKSGDSIEGIVKRADMALYEAKKSRNKYAVEL